MFLIVSLEPVLYGSGLRTANVLDFGLRLPLLTVTSLYNGTVPYLVPYRYRTLSQPSFALPNTVSFFLLGLQHPDQNEKTRFPRWLNQAHKRAQSEEEKDPPEDSLHASNRPLQLQKSIMILRPKVSIISARKKL